MRASLGLALAAGVGTEGGLLSPPCAESPRPLAGAGACGFARARAFLGALPLGFEPNLGQAAHGVAFVGRGPGFGVSLLPSGALVSLRSTRLQIRLVGADPRAEAEGVSRLPGRSNYLLGADRSRWVLDVQRFEKVRFPEVLPATDVLWYGNRGHLEFDLVLRPGADPEAIEIEVSGARDVRVTASGELALSTGLGEVRLGRPAVYQHAEGGRAAVAASHLRRGKNRFGVRVGAFDRRRVLIVDPVLYWSTYLGGNLSDSARCVAVDGSGNVYIAGDTESANFPTAAPMQSASAGSSDAFVTKLNPSGAALVYSTYLGGSGWDVANRVAVDAAGNVVLAGGTASSNFPTTGAIQPTFGGGTSDAFVAKLNPSGSALIHAAYLGGGGAEGCYGLALDVSGNAYVSGWTGSNDFPTVSPLQATRSGGYDAFVTKFNASGTALVYSTYLGGTGSDIGGECAVDAAGDAFVTGDTASSAFPVFNAMQPALAGGSDAFVSKLNPAGSALVYSTYLGGSGSDWGKGVAVDGSGAAYLTGSTDSTDFPTANPVQAAYGGGLLDAYVTKLNPTGSALIYSTYLGGSGLDAAFSCAVDSAGRACATGYTGSTDFPTAGAIQPTHAGGTDAFLSRLNPVGSSLSHSTFLGGAATDGAWQVALDLAGDAHLAGWTQSSDFPVVFAYQPVRAGMTDAFVAKISEVSPTPLTGTPTYSLTSSATLTASVSLTLSPTPTISQSPAGTPVPTETCTGSRSPTRTASYTASPSGTASSSRTSTGAWSGSPSATGTAGGTYTTAGSSATPTRSATSSVSPTLTASAAIVSSTPTVLAPPPFLQLDRNLVRPAQWPLFISFALDRDAEVRITVRNAAGELVRGLWSGRARARSVYRTAWWGENDQGREVGSNVYAVHLGSKVVSTVKRVGVAR